MMRLGGLAALAMLAGCLASSPAADLAPASVPDAAAPSALAVASDCQEGGGHSNYWRDDLQSLLPEPWVAADVADDLGRPVISSNGIPVTGEQAGIYHTTVVCEAWSFDGVAVDGPLVWGFVGIRVEPPPFDDGSATAHYLLDVLSFEPADLLARVAGAGVHASEGTGSLAWRDGDVLHTILDDVDHGHYEAVLPVKEKGAKVDGVTRLWMLHGEDGAYRPASLDLVDAGGGAHWVVATPAAAFAHTDTQDHAPLPAGTGNVAALAYTGFDRTLRLGPAPDVVLAENWAH